MPLKTAAAFAGMISCTVAGNLLLKSGAVEALGRSAWWGLLNLKTVSGLAFFGAAVLVYLWVLRTVPLNVAQSFMAAQFISVIVASALVLSEPISAIRWLGIALIAIGIVIVGHS